MREAVEEAGKGPSTWGARRNCQISRGRIGSESWCPGACSHCGFASSDSFEGEWKACVCIIFVLMRVMVAEVVVVVIDDIIP